MTIINVIKILATASAALCWFMSARVALTPIERRWEIRMSDWHDVKGDNPAPHGRLLLLLTKPDKFDAADEVYDIYGRLLA